MTYTRRGNREGISGAYSLDSTSLIYSPARQARERALRIDEYSKAQKPTIREINADRKP